VSEYVRAFSPGGTFFFTVITHRRAPIFRNATARRFLRESIAHVRRNRPFTVEGMVLLPEHLHCVWTLPDGDTDFSTRWRKIKEGFTRAYLASRVGIERSVTPATRGKGNRGVWQQRFWEHTIRDESDFAGHMNYIHYNAVKHGHVNCPHAYPFSTFNKWIRRGIYTDK
jgi:REP-associated tyrosine transposase